jgi:hypothetical protein
MHRTFTIAATSAVLVVALAACGNKDNQYADTTSGTAAGSISPAPGAVGTDTTRRDSLTTPGMPSSAGTPGAPGTAGTAGSMTPGTPTGTDTATKKKTP